MAYYIGTFKDYEKIPDKGRFKEYARISNGMPDYLKSHSEIQDWAFLAPYESLQNHFIKNDWSEPRLVNEYILYLEKIWPSICFIFGCHGQDTDDILFLCPDEKDGFSLRKVLTFFMKNHGYPLIDFIAE